VLRAGVVLGEMAVLSLAPLECSEEAQVYQLAFEVRSEWLGMGRGVAGRGGTSRVRLG
jgi:hypothetical protein